MLTDQVNIGLAFLAGLASFLAPCVLPLVPAYLSYLSGYTLSDLSPDDRPAVRWPVVAHALAFVLGFSVVFILLGIAAGALGQLVRGDLLRYLGGGLLILFGLTLTGLLEIPLFDRGTPLPANREGRWRYLSSLLTGIGFGAGWTPCVGPVLGSILVLSADQTTLWRGVGLLAAYAAGIGIPFILAALLVDRAGAVLQRLRPYQPIIRVATGALIFVFGIVLIADGFSAIGLWLEQRGIGWQPNL